MKVTKTVYNSRLREPYSYTVECNGKKAEFQHGEESKVSEWVKGIWDEQEDGFFNTYSPAYIYYNIDWDCDHVLYAKYERIA